MSSSLPSTNAVLQRKFRVLQLATLPLAQLRSSTLRSTTSTLLVDPGVLVMASCCCCCRCCRLDSWLVVGDVDVVELLSKIWLITASTSSTPSSSCCPGCAGRRRGFGGRVDSRSSQGARHCARRGLVSVATYTSLIHKYVTYHMFKRIICSSIHTYHMCRCMCI